MEPEDGLTITENVLRDLIQDILGDKYGAEWITQRVDEETRERWQDRLTEEKGRRAGVKVDDRLIYYSDLGDLPKLIKNDWEAFKPCFGNLKTTELYLKKLIGFRHAKQHGRDLLPFERDLLAGITGEIRNKATVFRSAKGPDQEYFPKIEYIGDSFGNVVRPPHGRNETGLTLRPGDTVTFKCRGWDPRGEPLDWVWSVTPGQGHSREGRQTEGDEFMWAVADADVAEVVRVTVFVLSRRPFHRNGSYDDAVSFIYKVLPHTL